MNTLPEKGLPSPYHQDYQFTSLLDVLLVYTYLAVVASITISSKQQVKVHKTKHCPMVEKQEKQMCHIGSNLGTNCQQLNNKRKENHCLTAVGTQITFTPEVYSCPHDAKNAAYSTNNINGSTINCPYKFGVPEWG